MAVTGTIRYDIGSHSLEGHGAVLGHLGAVVGACWGELGPSWRPLGAVLGPLESLLGASWELSGRSWSDLGAILGLLEGYEGGNPEMDDHLSNRQNSSTSCLKCSCFG